MRGERDARPQRRIGDRLERGGAQRELPCPDVEARAALGHAAQTRPLRPAEALPRGRSTVLVHDPTLAPRGLLARGVELEKERLE